jgi:hypothetical protein
MSPQLAVPMQPDAENQSCSPQSEILNRQGHPALALGTRNAKTEMA